MGSGIWDQMKSITIAGEPLINILWCTGIILATFILKKPLTVFFSRLSSAVANRFGDKKHGATFRELTHKPLELLLSTVLLYVAVNQLSVLLNLTVFSRGKKAGAGFIIRISDLVDKLFLLLIILFFILLVTRIVDYIFHTYLDRAREEGNREKEQLLPLLKDMMKISLGIIGLFWILGSVFSVNIPALITGIGIGGVAIALAAKESVENFFASFIILTDKPFRTGDIIKIGNYEGMVERVGFRSTRLRHADGSLFIIPNKTIIGENLSNLSERSFRRVQLDIPLGYGFPPAGLEAIMKELGDVLARQSILRNKPEILLEQFSESVFRLIILYYLPSPLPPGQTLNGIKNKINMEIYAVIEKHTTLKGISTSVLANRPSPNPPGDS